MISTTDIKERSRMHPAWRNLFRRCAVYHRIEAVETAAVIGPHTNSLSITKTYADGSTVAYTYTPDNLPLRTTFASGRWKENVYDERRQVVAVEYSDGDTVSLAYDAFLNEIAFSNDVAAANFDRDAKGNCTNDAAVVGNESKTTRRTFDGFSRLTGIDGTIYDYNADGLLASISNDIALVEYAYTPDRLDAGYSLTLSNGVVFTRSLVRDGYRRSLVSGISSVANGVGVGSLAYTYDALNRPATRNNDTFGYNARGEVVFSRRDAENAEELYSYDDIGNLLLSAFNTATNTYTANNLNQYTSILRASASPCEVIHDADGNMLSDGNLSFTYDAANRLKTVSSNGVLLVTNFYDAKSRRVKKEAQESTTTFFYAGWNLVEERISYTNGTSSTIHYYWGKDLSGTLQGAGGVGGLLYLTIDGVPYVPDYDNIGNITRYLDENGNVVAQYTYDAFGGTLSQSGTMCDVFRHRFSTKYLDIETSLYYYGYRFYRPNLGRWLNRDPIEEKGSVNIYAFCANNPIANYDRDGRAYFAVRKLKNCPLIVKWSWFVSNPFAKVAVDVAADYLNIEILHEQLFFEDSGYDLTSVGWGTDENGKEKRLENESMDGYIKRDGGYDDCIMRIAVEKVKSDHYQLTWVGPKTKCNCQDYCSALRAMYGQLKNDPEVKCKCKKGK